MHRHIYCDIFNSIPFQSMLSRISNAFRFLALLLWEIPLRRETVCVDTPRSSGKKACVNCQHQIDTGAANLLPGQHSRACATRTLTVSSMHTGLGKSLGFPATGNPEQGHMWSFSNTRSISCCQYMENESRTANMFLPHVPRWHVNTSRVAGEALTWRCT